MLNVRLAAIFLSSLLLITGIVAETSANDGNAALLKKGRAKAQGCTHCHGRNGLADAASRAGVDSVGLFAKQGLQAYKQGTRSHLVMSAIAQSLSEEDIDLIALWLDSVR